MIELPINGEASHPFIPNTASDRAVMLAAIGVDAFDELIADIPLAHRYPDLELPDSASELEVVAELRSMASSNAEPGVMPSFLGAGAYRHFIPSTVNALLQRGEFVTSYTPYQPEASQGSLQAGFEFQSAVCQLFDMEVANAGMYDGPTAFAEALLMAARITRRKRLLILNSIDDRLVQVATAYSQYQDVTIQTVSHREALDGAIDSSVACIAFQSPNFLGRIEDARAFSALAHHHGALSVMHTNPIANALFKPPGALGVDIATAEGQPLGVPLSFGGSYIGILASRKRHIRQLPGRIIGKTMDTRGRDGYTLTLQTREQHIRRERATSNICTSTQLIALMVGIYLATMGPRGIREAAELSYHKAHYMADAIDGLDGWRVARDATIGNSGAASVFFNEFPVECPLSPGEVNRRLLDQGIIGGLDISELIPRGMLLCTTEMNTRSEIDRLIQALSEINAVDAA